MLRALTIAPSSRPWKICLSRLSSLRYSAQSTCQNSRADNRNCSHILLGNRRQNRRMQQVLSADFVQVVLLVNRVRLKKWQANERRDFRRRVIRPSASKQQQGSKIVRREDRRNCRASLGRPTLKKGSILWERTTRNRSPWGRRVPKCPKKRQRFPSERSVQIWTLQIQNQTRIKTRQAKISKPGRELK